MWLQWSPEIMFLRRGRGAGQRLAAASLSRSRRMKAQGLAMASGALERPRCRLTPREREIVKLIAEGRSSKEVADQLRISVKTVETHRSNLMRKLNLHSVSQLVRYAIRKKLIEP